jgi:hypothetical protein
MGTPNSHSNTQPAAPRWPNRVRSSVRIRVSRDGVARYSYAQAEQGSYPKEYRRMFARCAGTKGLILTETWITGRPCKTAVFCLLSDTY